jgi:hypothetical protein
MQHTSISCEPPALSRVRLQWLIDPVLLLLLLLLAFLNSSTRHFGGVVVTDPLQIDKE